MESTLPPMDQSRLAHPLCRNQVWLLIGSYHVYHDPKPLPSGRDLPLD